MSGIDVLKDLFKKMMYDQLKIWENNCPYSDEQVEMYKFTVEHCIQEIESQRYLEDFTLNFFKDLADLSRVVYKEKPEITSFNDYVKQIVVKELNN